MQALLNAVERDRGGVAVVWCPDLGLRSWLADEVAVLVPSARRPQRVSSLEEALAIPDQLALWLPNNEREAVLDLDGSRDLLRANPPRTQPIVLFLLRNGDGAEALSLEATSLWSITAGSTVDPEELSEIDPEVERGHFRAEQGQTVEEWLQRWRKGELAQTGQNCMVAYKAMLLEAT